MKTFIIKCLKSIWNLIKRFYQALASLSKKFSTSSEKHIRYNVQQAKHYYRKKTEFNSKNFNIRKNFFRYTSILTFSILGIVLIFYLLMNSLFIVPVGKSAAILRFGEYVREAEAGLRLKLPIVERVYIVNTGNYMEERFGFIQTSPPEIFYKPGQVKLEQINKSQAQPMASQSQATEMAHSQSLEKPKPHILQTKGSIEDAVKKKPKLNLDYLRQKFFPDRTPPTKIAISNLKSREEKTKAYLQSGADLSGRLPLKSEKQNIAGDLTLINIIWTMQYKIVNPKEFLFNSLDTQQNIRDIAVAMMSEAIGSESFYRILGDNRQEIEKTVKDNIQQIIDKEKLGIEVTEIIILDTMPDQKVIPSFNAVTAARQNLEKITNEAERRVMEIIPAARGKAKQIVSDAEAYAILKVKTAEGEAAQFNQYLAQYRLAPTITKAHLYISTMSKLLNTTPSTIVDQSIEGVLPVLMNNPLPKPDKSSSTAAGAGVIKQLTEYTSRHSNTKSAQAAKTPPKRNPKALPQSTTQAIQ